VLVTGFVVAAVTLLGRWIVRLLADGRYFEAHEALPWVALGWALYGLYLVFVTIAGRAKVTTRNFPAAAAGLVVNVVVLVALVGPLGIAGAGIALCSSYLVMVVAIHLFTRRLFHVPFEWDRLALLAAVFGGVAVAGELLLPTSGADGLALRILALGAIPLLLVALRFLRPEETARLRTLATRSASRVQMNGRG
jgi:O-antigen/teichoic acid export membrane protein